MAPNTLDQNRSADPTAGSTTLMEILEDLRDADFGAQLIAEIDGDGSGKVRCSSCSTEHDPASLTPVGYRRIEGASDAADMNLVVWSTCGNCGTGATLILGYGPNASAEDDAVLQEISLSETTEPGATPDES